MAYTIICTNLPREPFHEYFLGKYKSINSIIMLFSQKYATLYHSTSEQMICFNLMQ